MHMNSLTGTVLRKYTSDKFAKLTVEVPGTGRYPERIDLKSFNQAVINQVGRLGAGESVTVEFNIQVEKMKHNGVELTEEGKDGKSYPVKVPMLVISNILVDGSGAGVDGAKNPVDDSQVPF